MTHIVTRTVELGELVMLQVEAGTTGKITGDKGHGGRDYFRLKNLSQGDIVINSSKNELEIISGGELERFALIEALQFILGELQTKTKLESGGKEYNVRELPF